jgi:hypothetical protein
VILHEGEKRLGGLRSYMALDGPHLDGLIGSAGVLRFDRPEKKTYIQHFEGISAAHNVSIAHNGQLALLGNFSQQIVLLDISDRNHAVVDIPLDTFDQPRVVRTMPSALNRFLQWPKRGRNVLGAFSRKSVPSSTHFVLQTLQVSPLPIRLARAPSRHSPQRNRRPLDIEEAGG